MIHNFVDYSYSMFSSRVVWFVFKFAYQNKISAFFYIFSQIIEILISQYDLQSLGMFITIVTHHRPSEIFVIHARMKMFNLQKVVLSICDYSEKIDPESIEIYVGYSVKFLHHFNNGIRNKYYLNGCICSNCYVKDYDKCVL